MKRNTWILTFFLIMTFFVFNVAPAGAVAVNLYDWAFNVDGVSYHHGNPENDDLSAVPGLDYSAFDSSSGLGTLEWEYTATTNEDLFFIAFFDHEIDEPTNTYFNEYGAAHGTPSAGQSWEIDEPGFISGDIYDNVLDGTLDNSNSVPTGSIDDVSMAMGWDFTILAGQTATIKLFLKDVLPDELFYLSHTDPDPNSDYTIYFSSTLEITGGSEPSPVPEPATMLLLGAGLVGLMGLRKRREKAA